MGSAERPPRADSQSELLHERQWRGVARAEHRSRGIDDGPRVVPRHTDEGTDPRRHEDRGRTPPPPVENAGEPGERRRCREGGIAVAVEVERQVEAVELDTRRGSGQRTGDDVGGTMPTFSAT